MCLSRKTFETSPLVPEDSSTLNIFPSFIVFKFNCLNNLVGKNGISSILLILFLSLNLIISAKICDFLYDDYLVLKFL